jgi:hypothetical protein
MIRLDPIAVAPAAHITLETRGEKTSGLTIKVAGQDSFTLPVREPVKLIAQHIEVRGIADSPFQENEELTYRIRLPDRAPWIEIAAQQDGPILSPTLTSGPSTTTSFSGLQVTTLDFTRQDSAGQRVSALTDEGTITFPDYPHLGTVPVSKDDAIGLERLERFTIKEISLATKTGGLHLIGDGMAKQVRTKTGQIPIQSRRLTAFDALWHNPQLAALFTIIVWVIPTTLGALKFWKEFKR